MSSNPPTGIFGSITSKLSRLSMPEVIVIVVVGLILFVLFSYGGARIGAWRSERAFQKEKSARLKEVQTALAAADAATKKAEAKEAQADQLGQLNGQKASVASAKQADLEKKDAENQNAIATEYQNTKARIDQPASDCDRLRDACASAERLGLKLESCSEPCPDQPN